MASKAQTFRRPSHDAQAPLAGHEKKISMIEMRLTQPASAF
jgi:hypothetical protein